MSPQFVENLMVGEGFSMNKVLLGDVIAGIIILIGSRIPNLVISSSYFAYMDNVESFYMAEYMLTSLFLFAAVLYWAYFVKNMITGKYHKG